MPFHLVIAGGGFGGFHAARALDRMLPPERARITLVNDVNFLLWTPLLPGAAAGALEPRHIVVPLREQLRRSDLRLAHVRAADHDHNELHVRRVAGHDATIRYDRLIVALGSVSKTLPIPWRGFPARFLARSYQVATMPGLKRRARLITDWTTGLAFGRHTSELGQLGHPPTLNDLMLREQSAGGSHAPGGASSDRRFAPQAGSTTPLPVPGAAAMHAPPIT